MHLKQVAGGAVFVLFAVAMLIPGCKKDSDETTPVVPGPTGDMQVFVSNEIDGQPIQLGELIYTNAAGNLYQVDLLKYYLSNVTLIKADSTEYNLKNYELINAAVDTTCQFSGSGIPNGNYTRMRFNLGIDTARNHTGAQEGDLDPINGMIWTWNTGYIFFKHEGIFRTTAGTDTSLLYHYGTDPVLVTVDLPLTNFEIKGNSRKVFLTFNLNQLYSNPTVVDFNNNNIHQSTSLDDRPWMSALLGNFPQSFSIDHVE
ncbi:MAG TPA: hypothetical protein PLU53_01660 [Bacteroidia bacterium]|nr:hypothetical protein [Bacteroidia bacterium]